MGVWPNVARNFQCSALCYSLQTTETCKNTIKITICNYCFNTLQISNLIKYIILHVISNHCLIFFVYSLTVFYLEFISSQ